MEHVGGVLAQFKNFPCDLATVTVIAETTLPLSSCQKWLQMDEIAWYEVRIKSGDVIGACGFGFAPIQQFCHDLARVAIVAVVPHH